MMTNEFDSTEMWPFKHEPVSLDEMVLSNDIRERLKKIIKTRPNILLIGPAGVGKGTFTNIFLKETGLDSMKINCSDETSIDNVRNNIKSFATALGRNPLKVVIMNEMDWLSLPAQAMLRDLIEKVEKITRFIFMCNYGDKLMPELVSRCQVISLNAPPEKDIIIFCWKILKKEKVIIKDKIAIIEMIRKLYPDIRGIINTLQYNTIDNTIDEIKIIEVSIIYKEVLENIKKVDLNEIRRILRSNAVNYSDLYNFLFSSIDEFKSPGDMIIEIGDALYRDSFFSIKEINFMRFIARCIKEKYI